MPIITNTQNAAVRAANIAMALTFFPRAKNWLFQKLCGTYTSHSAVEPLPAIGSVPSMQMFRGSLKLQGIPSFNIQVPNQLYKSGIKLDQGDLEFDQTGTLLRLSPAMGVRLADLPEQVFISKLIRGATTAATSAKYQTITETFRNVSYTMTMDGLSHFNTAHTTWSDGTQSNIVSGTHPATVALIQGQSVAETARQMISDFQAVLANIHNVRDTSGTPIFPSLEPEKALIVIVPPILKPAADLAFRTPGSVINQTTNIMPSFVKAVYSSGYLAGMQDPGNNLENIVPGTTSSLTANATDWYVLIDDDFIKPFFWQQYAPRPGTDDIFGGGYNVAAEVDRVMSQGSNITVPQATMWASSRIDSTFNRIGADADIPTIESEAFAISNRSRMNMVYGPWFLSHKVKPSGGA